MSPSQLCPDKYTDIINKLKEKEKVIFEKRATAGSKHIKCGKCGESDVAVTAAQTRSGDEGITLFMTCNNCGKQWKRS
jgi:DNA-directed RNA polymerase I subunit RPA12